MSAVYSVSKTSCAILRVTNHIIALRCPDHFFWQILLDYHQMFKITIQRALFGGVIALTGHSYNLVPVAHLLHTTYRLLPITYYPLASIYFLLRIASYLLLATDYPQPTTYHLLPTTCYLLRFYHLSLTTCYQILFTYYLLPSK